MEPSKKKLFEENAPVIHKIKELPQIVFEKDICRLPASTVALKELFFKNQMDAYHVDRLILIKIARQVWEILKELSKREIYPGLVSINDIYVDMNQLSYQVYLLRPEKFQILDYEQDYEWYPEDEKLFDSMELFDAKTQIKSDCRLIYRILTGSTRGNLKYPPGKTQVDYSQIFFRILPERIREFFENGFETTYEDMEQELCYVMEQEEDFARETKEQLDDKARKAQKQQWTSQEAQMSNDTEKESMLRVIFTIIRTELTDTRQISKMFYLLEDRLEEECSMKKDRLSQAFVWGDGTICVRDYMEYQKGFRCQLKQRIQEYSAGEALLITADLLEADEKKSMQDVERRVYLLIDGNLKNDVIFQQGLHKLKQLTQKGITCIPIIREGTACEACQKICELFPKEENTDAVRPFEKI